MGTRYDRTAMQDGANFSVDPRARNQEYDKGTAAVTPREPHEVHAEARDERPCESEHLLRFVFEPAANHLERAVAIMSLDDLDMLVTIAASELASSLRSDALSRIDEIRGSKMLTEEHFAHLAPCLEEQDLIAHAAALMDDCGYDWSEHCTADTVEALTSAMSACRNISEAVALEDAFLYIAYNRPDLRGYLPTCRPDVSPMHALFDLAFIENASRSETRRAPVVACG